jgi:hypothetical protein
VAGPWLRRPPPPPLLLSLRHGGGGGFGLKGKTLRELGFRGVAASFIGRPC